MATRREVPIPSIETGLVGNDATEDVSFSSSSISEPRTPSVSAPSLKSFSTENNSPSIDRARDGLSQDGITYGLQKICLSDSNYVPGNSRRAEAGDQVAHEPDTHAASLSVEPTRSRTGTPRRKRGGRRSSANHDRAPHCVSTEELPDDSFHSPEFQQAFQDAKQLMSTVEAVLGSSPIHLDPNSTMKGLFESARELAGFEYPSSRTVGFVGDSGVGEYILYFNMATYLTSSRQKQST